MTDDLLQDVKKRHRQDPRTVLFCNACHQHWPCDAIRLAGVIDKALDPGEWVGTPTAEELRGAIREDLSRTEPTEEEGP